MKPIKGNKVALSDKQELTYADVFGDRSGMPDELKAELDAQGLVGRWLSAKKVYDNQGYHPKGWRVYKRKNAGLTSNEFSTGKDPDGVVRRGDLILGVKTVE
jgi:hypothetical protein